MIASTASNKVRLTIFLYFLNDTHMKGKDIQMQSMLGDQESTHKAIYPLGGQLRHAVILEAMI